MRFAARMIAAAAIAGRFVMAFSSDIADLGEDGFIDSSGVKIHYVAKGAGPLVVLIHGCPDFWYTWRHQIPALARHFQVVAVDLRGYNLSDQPKGVENYTIDNLVGDLEAVVGQFGQKKTTIIGHDWGVTSAGATRWRILTRPIGSSF